MVGFCFVGFFVGFCFVVFLRGVREIDYNFTNGGVVLLGRSEGGNRLLSTEHQDLGVLRCVLKTPFVTGVLEPWNDALVRRWLKGCESFFLLPAAIESAVCAAVTESP